MTAMRFTLALKGIGLTPARMQAILTALVVMASLLRKARRIGGLGSFGAARGEGQ
jgi:hypothetical protein